jgi:DNA adenine methylase
VVDFFRVLRDPLMAKVLEDRLRLTPFARVEFEEARRPSDDLIENARRLLVRSFMGFGAASVTPGHQSGFRNNCRRSGTTGAHDWASWPDNVAALTARLAGVCIENRLALDVICTFDSVETLFYVDPPYPWSTRGSGPRDEYVFEMDDEAHVLLAGRLHGLRGMCVVSGYDCSLYRDLYRGWESVRCVARADGSGARTEVLWISPRASAAMVQRGFDYHEQIQRSL